MNPSAIPALPVGAASRREFLRRAGAFSITGVAAPLALNLAAMAEAAAQQAPADYKALVCVFLYGANDHYNTVVPFDTADYATYARIRQSLARPLDSLAATVLDAPGPLPEGKRFALAPELAPLLPLWAAQKLAVQLNVGPLIVPTTKADYTAARVPLPPKLFSHNDQQSIWQSLAAEGATSGWGGRIADLFAAGNGNATFSAVNVSGNAVFISGRGTPQYQVSPNGSVPLSAKSAPVYGSAAVASVLQQLVQAPRTHLMELAHTEVMRRAVDADAALSSALKSAPALATGFSAAGLAQQLRMVARMVSVRGQLGARRQVFFVSLGGFDLHDNLVDNHPALLAQVAEAMRAFYDATVELGVADQVTTFTASDFGRTLTSNGDGSDHGWGSHHLVAGGAVKGGRFYGRAPALADNGPDDVGRGRLLPSTSVTAFAATRIRNWCCRVWRTSARAASGSFDRACGTMAVRCPCP
jgi:uncharacterized protein (DUF1501 family)